MGTAEEIANVLCFMLSDEASFVTGGMLKSQTSGSNIANILAASWVVDGGYNAGRSAN
jgi:NAD(P)-dependent dehydrogenase (short-subunit alcohol dehydrogenase family)